MVSFLKWVWENAAPPKKTKIQLSVRLFSPSFRASKSVSFPQHKFQINTSVRERSDYSSVIVKRLPLVKVIS